MHTQDPDRLVHACHGSPEIITQCIDSIDVSASPRSHPTCDSTGLRSALPERPAAQFDSIHPNSAKELTLSCPQELWQPAHSQPGEIRRRCRGQHASLPSHEVYKRKASSIHISRATGTMRNDRCIKTAWEILPRVQKSWWAQICI